MTGVRIERRWVRAMEDHARASYPDECCGFLVGRPEAGPGSDVREIVGTEPAANEYDGERTRRFLVRPEELRDAEDRARARGAVVVGFYHSHPDHPAEPSQLDEVHAWPWYTYLVLGVSAESVGEVRAFELEAESRRFHEVPVENSATTAPAGRVPWVSENV